MFIRYRKIIADGHRPCGVHAKIACRGRCHAVSGRWGIRGRREGQCPLKPRCRWRIGLGAVDAAIAVHIPAPYRLQVQLVENRRDGNRVRQEHVATLGSVDGHLLPEFWRGVDPAFAATIKIASADGYRRLAELDFDPLLAGDREDWDMLSVAARAAFWDQAKPRLDRLENRLDPKTIRMAIHQRIPWPMQAERELAEARNDFAFWKAAYDGQIKHIEGHEKVIATANEQIAEARENAEKWAPLVAAATRRLSKAQS